MSEQCSTTDGSAKQKKIIQLLRFGDAFPLTILAFIYCAHKKLSLWDFKEEPTTNASLFYGQAVERIDLDEPADLTGCTLPGKTVLGAWNLTVE
jgi:hypothetical protein